MIRKIISSPILMLILTLIYCISMGIATFIEKDFGVEASRGYIYHNIWFILLQLFIVTNAVAIIYKRGVFAWNKVGILLFHLSFLIILLGAMVTHLWSKEGVIHIREGMTVDVVHLNDNSLVKLPVAITLDDFVLDRYPGSRSPSSYESHVTVEYDGKQSKKLIKMNKVMNIGGYRFFQQSYDLDERGSFLIVNYDFPGMQITYLGYILLLLGFIITPLQRHSRFRTLNRNLKKLGITSLLILLTLSGQGQMQGDMDDIMGHPQSNGNMRIPSVSQSHAKKFGGILVQNPKGRLEPMNTWSSELVRKILKDNSFKNYNSDQILLNLFLFPNEWNTLPLIQIENKEIRKIFHNDSEALSYNDFFNSNGYYRIQNVIEKAYELSPSERNSYYKDIISLDESINLIFQIQQGGLMAIFPHPNPENSKWLSPGDDISEIRGQDSMFLSKIMVLYSEMIHNSFVTTDWTGADDVLGMIKIYQNSRNTIEVSEDRISAELVYNDLNIFGRIFKFYLIAGGLLLVLCFYQLLKGDIRFKYLEYLLLSVITLSFIAQTIGFGLRWYISNYPPWSNSYETMLFVGWGVALIGLCLASKATIVSALSFILAGVLLFVASLNWMNPDITPLVPVLKSYWLMLHVAVIMMGYGFFFICTLIGIFNMLVGIFMKDSNHKLLLLTIKKCTILNEMSMIIGTILMCLGIFLGAVWANESWGRYWGWDPKETWALITMMVYMLILHMRFIPKLNNIWLFNTCSAWGIISVLMTYFGVNYYLTGLHSYGSSGGTLFSLPVVIGVYFLVVITLLLTFKIKRSKK